MGGVASGSTAGYRPGMYAITIREPGGPEVLEWTEVPDPRPQPGEVLIEIAASAVNRADILQRRGHYPPPPGAPPYPGLECSGRVIATASSDWHDGDLVCALLPGGGYAERVAVPGELLLPIPRGVSLEDAAALPEVACTVWSNIGFLRKGQVLLVHGGASGVGTFAIQFARARGAQVWCTASRNKHDRLRQLGAEPIDYRTEDFVEVVKRGTDGHGADVVLDIMGAVYLERNLDVLATEGHLVVIAVQGGRKAELDLARLLAKRATISATTLRSRPLKSKADIVRGVREQVWPLIENGMIRPVIDRRIPLRDAVEAHRVVESSAHIGKVLLTR